MKFSMEKGIKKFWVAGFFLPAINATVFSEVCGKKLVFYTLLLLKGCEEIKNLSV